MNGSRSSAECVLLMVWCGFLCVGIASAFAEEREWYSPSYQVSIGFHYAGQCDPGSCEGEEVLDLMATVENVVFGKAPMPDFGCWMYQKISGTMAPKFGHKEGEAAILSVSICPHLSGAGVEPNKIVARNDDFDINLSILPKQAGEDYFRETGGYGPGVLVPETLVDVAWMQFQAMTPFSNPAVEWENSDGNALANKWDVIFNVPVWKLQKGENFDIELPVEDDCGKGAWSIRFVPSD
jgi:hypothetical protein